MKFLIIVALSLAFTSTSYGQQPVNLSLIVTDTDNKGVNTISKEQLRIFEEGTEQTILSVEPDARPVDLLIAVDTSGSFKPFINSAIDVAKFVVVNRRPVDQIALIRFISSDKIEIAHEFTTDGDAVLKILQSFYLEGGESAVIDALYLSAQYVSKHNNENEARRKVVVIITDGEDRNSYYKETDLVNLLREEGVQVFIVGFVSELKTDGKSKKKSPREKAESLLTTIAEETGGRVFFPASKDELIQSTKEIILDLRAQFSVKYQSTNDASKNGFRKVDVQFVSTDGQTRKLIVPRGYYFGPKPPATKPEKKKKT